jgi:hypothetical protein
MYVPGEVICIKAWRRPFAYSRRPEGGARHEG